MLNHECSVICHARRRRTCRRTSCYNAQSNHITTSSNHTTDFTSTTQLDIRLSHTPAHVSPRAPRASVPRATGPARRSDKTSPNDQDHAHACASYNGANKLRYMCRLPFTLLPPALSTCPHLCHSNIEPPLASCCQTRPARSCTVTHRSSSACTVTHRSSSACTVTHRSSSACTVTHRSSSACTVTHWSSSACTVTHRSSGVHAPLRTRARTRRARPIRIRNAERRMPSCLRNA